MRRLLVLVLVPPLLGACRQEPDFDQRYAQAERQIRQSAREMDASLASTAAPGEEPAPARPAGRP